jgi:hypothetical protein
MIKISARQPHIKLAFPHLITCQSISDEGTLNYVAVSFACTYCSCTLQNWGHSGTELHHTRSYGRVIPCMGKFGIIPHHVVAATLHSKPHHDSDFKAPSFHPVTLGRMQIYSLHFQRGVSLSRHSTGGSTIHWN